MNTLSLAEKFIIPFLVLILLYLKPTRRCLATLDTFFHESFHALLSLLLGNKVKEIQFKESKLIKMHLKSVEYVLVLVLLHLKNQTQH